VVPQTAGMAEIVRAELGLFERARDGLREGAFVTRARARLWSSALLIGFAAAIFWLAATAHGANDYSGRPLGTDFSSFYSAGHLVLEGHPEAPFDPARQLHAEQQLFGKSTPFYAWAYPPIFFLVTAPLAALPYLPALAVWQFATLLLYLAGIALLLRRGFDLAADRTVLLVVLAFPAVFVNLTHGQNAFLTTALFGFALVMLDERPIVAGIFFGLLAYKPQFGLMIPVVLAATGRWRTFASAAVTVLMLVALTTLLFGADVWHAFFASIGFADREILDKGAVGYDKMQGTFAAARLLGGSTTVAYAAQCAVGVLIAIALVWLWRGPASPQIKGAALCIATLLVTPFCLDYDLVLLAVPIAWLALDGHAHGFLPWEKTALCALWLLPFVSRVVGSAVHVPLGAPVLMLGFAVALRRAYAIRRVEKFA
jgi:alpha-1,2-mannosyltransferase